MKVMLLKYESIKYDNGMITNLEDNPLSLEIDIYQDDKLIKVNTGSTYIQVWTKKYSFTKMDNNTYESKEISK